MGLGKERRGNGLPFPTTMIFIFIVKMRFSA